MATARLRLVLTCEHGGNRIPAPYRELFRGHEGSLGTHEGYDAGALALAQSLAKALRAPLVAATTSRLLIDLNRSAGHPGLYSDATRSAPPRLRREIMERHYRPYRQAAESEIANALAHGNRVVHVACHSFTPELGGVERNADIGLLYDPARPGEVAFCERWRTALAQAAPALKVRRNYPYRGKSDGFTTWLRRRFPAERYAGVELEVNQKHVRAGGRHWRAVRAALAQALAVALGAP